MTKDSSQKIHIGMVLDNGAASFPPDIRVEKEMQSLAAAGFKITVLTRSNKEKPVGKVWDEKLQGHIVRVDVKTQRSLSDKIKDALGMRASVWVEPLHNFIKEEKPDFLHAHDLLPVPTVLDVAEQYNIPVIADLHENMPAAMVAFRANYPFKKKLAHWIKRNYWLMKSNEGKALRRCLTTVVVVPEAVERVVSYGVAPEDVIVVSNTEDETTFMFSEEDALPEITDKYKHKWVMSYIGGMGQHRGLDTALDAVPLLKDKIENFLFLIVGAKPQEQALLKKQIEKLGIQDYVEVLGWQPFEKVNSYVMASDVCLVPHNNFEHTQTTVPHKLFQYMICKKPVLVSSCKPLQRIIDDAGSGMVFEVDSKNSFAEKILYMNQHPDEIKAMGERGHQAALAKYAWRNDAQVLIDMYNKKAKNS